MMHCREARRLLDHGLTPGVFDAQQTILGFHLAGCPDCRAYQARKADLQLLAGLLAEAPRVVKGKPRRKVKRLSHQAARAMSAAVLVGCTLAISPLPAPKAATAAPAVRPLLSSAALVQRGVQVTTQRAAAAVIQRTYLAQQLQQARRSDEAVLAALLASPPADVPQEAALVAPVEAPALEVALAVPVEAPALSELEALQQQGGTYTVVGGDYLWAIATRIYKDPILWRAIYVKNQGLIGENPNVIYPGQVFVIPSLAEAQQIHASTGFIPTYPTGYTFTGQGQPGGRAYVVQAGDTLWDISQAYYGTGANAYYLAGVNGIPNANYIVPGQVVYVP